MLDREFMVLLGTFRRLVRRNAKTNLIKVVRKTHAADLATLFRSFTESERNYVFDLIPELQYKARVLSEVDEKILQDLLENLDPATIVKLLGEMAPDDQADIVANLPKELEQKVFDLMSRRESADLEELMMYPPESAGGIMIPSPFKMKEEDTVRDAIDSLQRQEDLEMVFYVYVVDEHNKLSGVLPLRQLLTVVPHTKLREIMNTKVISVKPETDQEEVARIISRYDLLAIPVTDKENKLLGIVTVDDIIDVLREEATEDFLQMAGVGKDREILLKSPYEETKMRLPWLFATFIGGVIVSMIVSGFGDLINQFVLLAAFMPITAGMAGNVATQSSTIMVRGIATGRVNINQIARVLFRETKIGLLLGLVYGILLALFSIIFYHVQAEYVFRLAGSIGVSLMFAILIAATMGTLTPMLLNRFNIDPAVATGPLVTTIGDMLSVTIYFSIAVLLLTKI